MSNRRPDPNIFLWIAASVAAAAVNLNGKTHLANGLTTFFIKRKPVLSNSSIILPKSRFDCSILCYWVFDNFISAEEFFAQALQSPIACVLINKKLCGKLFSSLEPPAKIDEIFKVTSVPFPFQILIY